MLFAAWTETVTANSESVHPCLGPFRPFREVVELTERYIIGPYPAPYSVGFEKGCLFRLPALSGRSPATLPVCN